jgi:hypothetical protein
MAARFRLTHVNALTRFDCTAKAGPSPICIALLSSVRAWHSEFSEGGWITSLVGRKSIPAISRPTICAKSSAMQTRDPAVDAKQKN